MMKLQKLAMVLAFVFLLSATSAGCGATPAASPASAPPDATVSAGAEPSAPAADDPLKEHMDISIAIWDAEKCFRDGQKDAIYDTIAAKLNITITPVNVTYDDYQQKVQVWAASDQLPDVFAIDAINQAYYENWIKDGVVKALPEDMSAYPSLKKMLDNPDCQAYRYAKDGKLYCIPRTAYSSAKMWANEKAVLIRKDWMRQLGYEKDPESLDEMIALLKAFTDQNPEGKHGVIGYTVYDRNFLPWLMMPYNPVHAAGGDMWVRDNGKWTRGMFTERTLEGIKAMKKMWDAGVIDKDVATIKGDEGIDKFASGRAGALSYGGLPVTLSLVMQKFEKNYPDKKFKDCVSLLHPWKGPDGNYWYLEMPTPWSESYFKGSLDDKKIDRIFRLFDYLLSSEGLTLLRYGIEGVDYTKDGDKITVIRDKKDENGSIIPIAQDYNFLNGMHYLATWDQDFSYLDQNLDPYLLQLGNDMLNWYWENGKGCSELTDFRCDFIDYPSKDKLTAQFNEDLVKVLMSDDAEKAWKDMLQEYLGNGYDKVIADFNAAADAAGVKP